MKLFEIILSNKEMEIIRTEMKPENWERIKNYNQIDKGIHFIITVDEDSGTSLAGVLNSIAVTNHSDENYNVTKHGEEIEILAVKILNSIIGEPGTGI